MNNFTKGKAVIEPHKTETTIFSIRAVADHDNLGFEYSKSFADTYTDKGYHNANLIAAVLNTATELADEGLDAMEVIQGMTAKLKGLHNELINAKRDAFAAGACYAAQVGFVDETTAMAADQYARKQS